MSTLLRFLSTLFRVLLGSDIFLSYHWQTRTKQYALRLSGLLEERGFDCFIDEKRISRGEIVTRAIRREIRRCRLVVVLVTPEIGESTWVPQELAIAAEYGKKIVPVNFGGTMNGGFFDDKRWGPLRDRSRVEEELAALDEGIPAVHVTRQLDEAFEDTRQRVTAIRILFATGLVFFAVSIAAILSARRAVQVEADANKNIMSLKVIQKGLNKEVEELGRQKERLAGEAEAAGKDRDAAKAEAVDQRKLAFDQSLLRGYRTAWDSGDLTAAFLSVRSFRADERTSGWKDAAVAVLQNTLPTWQGEEELLDFNSRWRKIVTLTRSRRLIVRDLDRPERAIVLGGQESLLNEGISYGLKSIHWSSDGNFVSIFLTRQLGVWNINRPQKPVLMLDDGFVSSFSPETNLLAIDQAGAVAFWRLTVPPQDAGKQKLNGIVHEMLWQKGGESLLCAVGGVPGGAGYGLYEVSPRNWKKLIDGRFLQDYWLTSGGELVTRTEHRGPKATTDYLIRSLPLPDAHEYKLTLPGIHFRSFVDTAGQSGRFFLVGSENISPSGTTFWLADRENKTRSPVATASVPDDKFFGRPEHRVLPGNRLAVATDEGKKIHLFDLEHSATEKIFTASLSAISPDGNWLQTPDGFLNLEKSFTFSLPGPSPLRRAEINHVSYSSDGKFAAAHIKGTSKTALVDLVDLKVIDNIEHPGAPAVHLTNVTKREILTDGDGIIRVWRPGGPRESKIGDDDFQFAVAASASGNRVWLESGGSGHWNVESWQRSGSREFSLDFSNLPESVDVNEQQTRMLIVTEDLSGEGSRELRTRFQFWELDERARPKHIKTSDQFFKFATASHHNLRVLTLSAEQPPAIWVAPFDRPVVSIPSSKDMYRGALSNKGTAAALFRRSGLEADLIETWDLSDLRHPSKIADYVVRHFGNQTFDLAISDDGRNVVAFGRGQGYLFSRVFPKGTEFVGTTAGTRRLEFSPSGKRVIATLYGGGAVIWRLDTPEHPDLVLDNFSSDLALARFGKSDNDVITVTRDRSIRLWNTSGAGLRGELNRSPSICMTPGEIQKFLGQVESHEGLPACREPSR